MINRLAILVLALMASAGALMLAAVGAREFAAVMPLNPPPIWFVAGVGPFFLGLALLLRRRRESAKDDERLIPLVRRDPQTGVREL
jgi:MYXO-CTERM domain-containing protein